MFPISARNSSFRPLLAKRAIAAGQRHRDRSQAEAAPRKPINLALQGGGAHGAFTWGVLDQLLDGRADRDRRHFRDIGRRDQRGDASPTASCAAGPSAARQRLADFWRAVSVDGHLPDLQRGVVERLFAFVRRATVRRGSARCRASGRPMHLNPLNINPLKDLIERFVDFEAIRARHGLRAVHFGDQSCTPASCASFRATRSRRRW